MKTPQKPFDLLCAATLIGIFLMAPVAGIAQDSTPKYKIPEGVYIKLTEDFYRALSENNLSGEKVYGNKISDEYLRQISVSAKFMVDTNLQILRQQEKIIQLLQSLQEKKP